jgi:hypothetical protein
MLYNENKIDIVIYRKCCNYTIIITSNKINYYYVDDYYMYYMVLISVEMKNKLFSFILYGYVFQHQPSYFKET